MTTPITKDHPRPQPRNASVYLLAEIGVDDEGGGECCVVKGHHLVSSEVALGPQPPVRINKKP